MSCVSSHSTHTHKATNAQPLIMKRYGHCYVTAHRIIVAHSFDCWWRKIFVHPFCVTFVLSENTPSPTNNNVFCTVAHTLSYTRATNYNLIKNGTHKASIRHQQQQLSWPTKLFVLSISQSNLCILCSHESAASCQTDRLAAPTNTLNTSYERSCCRTLVPRQKC